MSANSFNLARRLSSRNENDLVRKCIFVNESDSSNDLRVENLLMLAFLFSFFTEEDMMENSQSTPPSSPLSHRACVELLDKVCPDSPLPKECERYQDVTVALKRRNTDPANHNIAFAGMHSGEAAMARAARERGMLNHAQIQRRMTSGKKTRIW